MAGQLGRLRKAALAAGGGRAKANTEDLCGGAGVNTLILCIAIFAPFAILALFAAIDPQRKRNTK